MLTLSTNFAKQESLLSTDQTKWAIIRMALNIMNVNM